MHGTQVQMTQFALQKLLHTSPFKQVNSQFYSNPVLKEFPGARLLVLNIFADCGPSGGPYTPWTSYINVNTFLYVSTSQVLFPNYKKYLHGIKLQF